MTRQQNTPDEAAQNNEYGNLFGAPRYFRLPGIEHEFDRGKILFVILLPLMMTLMQISSVNNALPAIQSSMHISSSALQWVLAGYALAIGLTLVPFGRIGDIFGRSRIFFIGLIIFTVTSLLVGTSTNSVMLNLLRFLQGIGSGILGPQITGLIQEHFSGRARAIAYSFFGLAISISVAAGPLLTGVLLGAFGDAVGWRLSFIINTPLGLLGLFLAWHWLPLPRKIYRTDDAASGSLSLPVSSESMRKNSEKSAKSRLDLDPIGMLLLTFSVLGIMLPLMMPEGTWKWLITVAALLLLFLWVKWESHYSARGRFPMVDLQLFKIPTFTYSAAISTLQFMGTTSVFAVLAIYLQSGLGMSAFQFGILNLPSATLAGVAAMWAGKRSYNHGRGLQVFALILILIGLATAISFAYFAETGLSFWWFMIPTMFIGFGNGTMGSANQTQAMLDVPSEHGGTAGGIMQTGQRLSTAIGTALVTAVFFSFHAKSTNEAHGWFIGFSAAYITIFTIIVVALSISLLFWKQGRRA